MKVVSLKVFHFSKWVVLASLILLALLSVAGRAILSNAEYFKNAIEQELADYGIKGVSLENVEGHWQGLQPLLTIKGASLSIPGRSHALSVNEMSLRVKLVPSLLSGDLILESFYSSIKKLVLVRDKKGIWWLNDIRLSATDNEDAELDIFAFFQRLPSFVDIDIGLLQLRDLNRGKDYFVEGSTLRSSRKKQRLSVKLLTRLPSSLGREVQFFLTGDEVKQQLFVKADRLNPAALFQLTSIEKIPSQKAVISLQSWVDLERFHLKQVITKAKISQLSVNLEKNKQQALSFSVEQKTVAEKHHWRVNTKVSNIKKGGHLFDDIRAQVLISKRGEKPLLWIDKVKLPLLRSVFKDVMNDESLIKLLDGLQPEASLENIVAELDINKPADSIFGLDIIDFNSRNVKFIPSLNGINGTIISALGVTQLDIDAQNVSLDFGDLFRQPIKLDTFKAKSYLVIKDKTLHVDTDYFSADNADISVEGRLRLEVAAKQRPFLSLRASYKNGKVKAVPPYLPVGIMHESVVKWIDKALLSGDITQGDLLFHGRLQNPALFSKNQSGIMLTAFNVHHPEIDYLAGWPIAQQGDVNIQFLNSSMNVDISKARYLNAAIDEANLKIPDFLAANMFLTAKTNTDAKDLLAVLSGLPILNVFEEVEQKTEVISGQVNTEVKLDVPLAAKLKKEISVTATADLKGVALSIPDWMIGFKELTGRLNIDNEKVSAKALSGKFYGDKVRLNISPDKHRLRTNFHLRGNVHTRNLLKLTPEYLYDPVSGISPWNVSVSVGHQPSKKSALLEIIANSTLSGTQLNFPHPSKVSKEQQRPVKLSASLFDKGDFPFELSLADGLRVNGRLNVTASSADTLQWLNVSLGGFNSIPEKPGITVAGTTELIDLDEFFEYQHRYFSEDDETSKPFLQQVKSVEIDVDRMILAGQQTLNSKIKVLNNGKQLLGTIDSTQAKGSFELPYRIGVLHPFMADLEFMKLSEPELSEKMDIDIGDMPNIYVKSKLVSYEKMVFSDLIFKTKNESNKFVIEQMDFSRDKVRLKSSGHWQFEPVTKEHVSVFNIDVKGSNFGQAINNLGLGETIEDGTIEFNGQIGWGGELYSINWPTLIGEVDLKLEDGFLKNVEPGAGRFVGLLSFSALPRRLFLDFGDVLKKGMGFDKIKGKFKIKGEILETSNASMNSVSAKVEVRGTTNLRYQTYHQTMTIIPKIGDTLPIIGTLAAGNAVGWGLLLLQKILKNPIDKSVGIEYKISGSWDNPQVNLIKKAKPKEIEGENFYDIDV